MCQTAQPYVSVIINENHSSSKTTQSGIFLFIIHYVNTIEKEKLYIGINGFRNANYIFSTIM